MTTGVKNEAIRCGHEDANQVNHGMPMAFALGNHSTGQGLSYPMIERARRHNHRAKEMVRHDSKWRAER
jgi:hypothetical protein